MRVLCNGKTLAFQANDTGSIPVTRSNNSLVLARLSQHDITIGVIISC